MGVKIEVDWDGVTYPAQIGVIESTRFGNEDHGILTLDLSLKFDGGGVSFGGYALDEWSEEARERVVTGGYGLDFIVQVMRTAGVERYEQLPGQKVLSLAAPGTKSFWGSSPVGIASLDATRVFLPKEHSAMWKAKEAGGMSQSGADLIKIEQARARHVEGYTPAHDVGHERDLVAAGAAYALDALGRVWVGPNGGSSYPVSPWPWAERFWKPTDDVKRELVRAGSLIASAIDALIAAESGDAQ